MAATIRSARSRLRTQKHADEVAVGAKGVPIESGAEGPEFHGVHQFMILALDHAQIADLEKQDVGEFLGHAEAVEGEAEMGVFHGAGESHKRCQDRVGLEGNERGLQQTLPRSKSRGPICANGCPGVVSGRRIATKSMNTFNPAILRTVTE